VEYGGALPRNIAYCHRPDDRVCDRCPVLLGLDDYLYREVDRAVACVVCQTKGVVSGVPFARLVQGRRILDSSLSHIRIARSVALPAHWPVLTKSGCSVMRHLSRSWATRLQPGIAFCR
jgi:hypothetical protein